MIDYENIRRIVSKGLKDYLKCPVIRSNQAVEAPDYPYVSYTITTLASENKGTYGEYADGIYRKPVNQIWSVTVLSDNDSECVNLAEKAREWFDLAGHIYLSDNNVVVQSVGSVTNRDNFITIDYEYRKGFDVTFSLFDEVKMDVETIDGIVFDNDVQVESLNEMLKKRLDGVL